MNPGFLNVDTDLCSKGFISFIPPLSLQMSILKVFISQGFIIKSIHLCPSANLSPLACPVRSTNTAGLSHCSLYLNHTYCYHKNSLYGRFSTFTAWLLPGNAEKKLNSVFYPSVSLYFVFTGQRTEVCKSNGWEKAIIFRQAGAG